MLQIYLLIETDNCYPRFTHAGAINENSPEYHAMKFAVNNASASSNVSIFLNAFNTSGDINLFSQGKIPF